MSPTLRLPRTDRVSALGDAAEAVYCRHGRTAEWHVTGGAMPRIRPITSQVMMMVPVIRQKRNRDGGHRPDRGGLTPVSISASKEKWAVRADCAPPRGALLARSGKRIALPGRPYGLPKSPDAVTRRCQKIGAGGRNRTDTPLPELDFESSASTSSTTPATRDVYNSPPATCQYMQINVRYSYLFEVLAKFRPSCGS